MADSPSHEPPVLELRNICKTYNEGLPSATEVLHHIDLVLQKGAFVALMGPSGSGKSTLLNIVGLLDRATSGTLILTGQDTQGLNDQTITKLRGKSIGFVFQYHCLITAFTALENVMMPMMLDGSFTNDEMQTRAHALLKEMDLDKWAGNLASNLSGGQQQRVAIARALAMNPALILADEPTGNLDSHSAEVVFDMMRKVNTTNGTTFLIVTHNHDLALRCDRIAEIIDGLMIQEPVRVAG